MKIQLIIIDEKFRIASLFEGLKKRGIYGYQYTQKVLSYDLAFIEKIWKFFRNQKFVLFPPV